MIQRVLGLCAAGLLCACTMGSNWYLMDSGYSINPVAGDPDVYAVEMHLNQLKDGSCVQRTRRSVTIAGRCVAA